MSRRTNESIPYLVAPASSKRELGGGFARGSEGDLNPCEAQGF